MDKNSDESRHLSCFKEWMNLQEQSLSQLLQTLAINPETDNRDAVLVPLIEENIIQHQDYIDKRNHMARDNVSVFFVPTWCTSLENSVFWIAGCRPSSYIRLVYALSGADIESQLAEFLQGARTGNLGELSAHQLSMVNSLQLRTVREEDRLSSRLASLQEEIADQPNELIAQGLKHIGGLVNGDADRVLDEHGQSMHGGYIGGG